MVSRDCSMASHGLNLWKNSTFFETNGLKVFSISQISYVLVRGVLLSRLIFNYIFIIQP